MTGARALRAVVLLAVLSIIGLVGMLLVDGYWDAVFFVMTLAPLLAGAWAVWRASK